MPTYTLLLVFMTLLHAEEDWVGASPRPELAPLFERHADGGRDGGGLLVITQDQRAELQGDWRRSYGVVGGTWIQFRAYCRHQGVALPRQSVLASLYWHGAEGQQVRREAPSIWPEAAHLYGDPQSGIWAMEEYPRVLPPAADGWQEVSGVYLVPRDAERVEVRLQLQFAPGATVAWSNVRVEAMAEPTRRTARVAAVNFEPAGGSEPLDNCRAAEPFIAEAAAKGAQLVVLSEHFPTQRLHGWHDAPHVASAEAIPGGPISGFFCELARKHALYIVVGMYQRDGLSVYNVAALFAPDGTVAGVYRKTAPTMGEMAKGIRPGAEYPVFDTPFGRVGMLVCWDTHFPEPARELAKRGAEIIAVPAYGFHTTLGQARALENQVHLVTSIYEDDGRSDPLHRWGITGVIDPEGKVVARAPGRHSVVVHEIDLTPRHWVWLGDLRSRLPANIPVVPAEP